MVMAGESISARASSLRAPASRARPGSRGRIVVVQLASARHGDTPLAALDGASARVIAPVYRLGEVKFPEHLRRRGPATYRSTTAVRARGVGRRARARA